MGENENEKARDKLHVFLLTPQWARFGSLLWIHDNYLIVALTSQIQKTNYTILQNISIVTITPLG